MTQETEDIYNDCINTMRQAEADGDVLKYQEARDRFRSLPGFPQNLDPIEDQVWPVRKPGKIISIGSIN